MAGKDRIQELPGLIMKVLRRMDTWLSRTYGTQKNFIIHFHQKEDR
jgi:hypothetical protein